MSSKGVKTIYFIIYVLPGDRGGWNLDRFLYLYVRCLWGIREHSEELKSRRGSRCSSSHTYIYLAVFQGRRWKMLCLLASTLSLSVPVAKQLLADQSAWFQEPTCFSTSIGVPGWEMHWFNVLSRGKECGERLCRTSNGLQCGEFSKAESSANWKI